MKEASDVVFAVVDHGLFFPVAQKLAEQCKHVYWWSPWEDVAPEMKKGTVGDGFEKITRVKSIWDIKDRCDAFCFPDVGFGGEQHELRSQGYPVWGHNGGDILEVDRGYFLDEIKRLGMPIPKYRVIKGMTNLKAYLKDEEDKWIKISKWRGDWETLHWRSWGQDESMLDGYSYRFGPLKEYVEFYVFDPLDTDIEDGIDTWCIEGQFPNTVMHGMECKDKSYLCSMQPLEDIDERVKMVTDKFGPVLGRFGYRGAFSCEVRIMDDEGYFIDPTCRFASPPSQVMTEMVENFGEVIWQGANGICIEPEPAAEFAGQVGLKVDRDCDEWMVLKIPDSIKKWVKCGFAVQVDGYLCIPPHPLKNMVGWLCATGDTMKECIDNLKEYAEELPDDVTCDLTSLAHLLEEAQSAREQGIEITEEQIPEPEVVL